MGEFSLPCMDFRSLMMLSRVKCDNCGGFVGEERIICLICQTKETFNTVDLCDAPECMAARVERDDLHSPHLPGHDLVKVRRVVFTREFGVMDREAKEALKRARSIFEGLKDQDAGESDEKGDQNAGNIQSPTEEPTTTEQPETNKVIKCVVCEEVVVQPCWYCVHCEGACHLLVSPNNQVY